MTFDPNSPWSPGNPFYPGGTGGTAGAGWPQSVPGEPVEEPLSGPGGPQPISNPDGTQTGVNPDGSRITPGNPPVFPGEPSWPNNYNYNVNVTSKGSLGDTYPVDAVKTASLQRLEPLITPNILISRFLFGIPLVSRIKDPITGVRARMTGELLADYITGAVSEAEELSSTVIFPVQFNEKKEFDRCEYLSFGYMTTAHRPVYAIDAMRVTPANNVDVFEVPLQWVETANLTKGLINLIPIGIALNGTAYGGGVVTGVGAGAAAFLAILGNQSWIPAFWRIVYTAGYPNAMVPRYINDLVGSIAAIHVLSELSATFFWGSSSLGIDGLSQSVSLVPQVFMARMQMLEEQKKKLIKQVKKNCGLLFFVGNI